MNGEKVKVLYPAQISLDFMFQRPGQLCSAFSKLGHESHFVNKNMMISGAINYKKVVEREKNFWVYPENFNLDDIKFDIILWSFPPVGIPLFSKYQDKFFIFDSLDYPGGIFRAWNSGNAYYKSLENSDLVLASSELLYQKAKDYNDNTIKVPNACDFNHFSQLNLSPPPEIKSKNKIVLYSGAVASWLDIELIKECAQEYPYCTFLICGGQMDRSIQSNEENIIYLGHIEYEKLPYYLTNSDVLTIPFKPETEVIKACNPIKVFEYLATGKPIVTTALEETKDIRNLYWSKNREEYLENIGKALSEKGKKKQKERIEFAKENTWEKRAQLILKRMEESYG